MTVEDLRAAVLAVPGVAAADVAIREDGVPMVRVWIRYIEGVDLISVLIETGVGERYAGAAVVRGGRPFTVGRAVDAALATAV